MKKIDLTGKTFGKLFVIKEAEPHHITPSGRKKVRWECQCECGKITNVDASNLKNGHTTSCGCNAHRDDLTNQVFGRLTVLEQTEGGWKCLCSCGNITTVRGYNLKNGNTKSCGCLQKDRTSEATFKSLIGQKFGKLTVLERVENNRFNQVCYKCKCECGGETIVSGNNLSQGITSSCGCVKSKGEMLINKWLVEHKINFIPQYSHDKIILLSGRRPIFDFAIFDENNNLLYLIEYQGKQHYFSGQGWNDKENHLETVRRDNEKRNQCSLLGIKLIEIPYWDLNKIDEILSNIFYFGVE